MPALRPWLRGGRRARRALGAALAAALWLAAGAAAPPAAAADATTSQGAAGAASAAPVRRIVSLNPSLTAILLALGARDALVGVDDFSARQQPEVADLPQVGGLFDPSLESVVALRPDLVVLVPSAAQRDFRGRLRELGVPVRAFDPVGFDEVLDTIEGLGAATGHEAAAQARVAAVRETRRRVREATATLPRPRVVLVLQRDPLYVIGRGSFVDAMLDAVHAENLGAALDAPYPPASREWLLAGAPEVLLDAAADPEPAAAYWSRWPSLPAVRDGRVVALPEGLVTLPGPWLDRALLALAEAVHGDTAREALGEVPANGS